MSDVDALFDAAFASLVRSLGVAFGAEAAADAVQEAFILADRKWSTVGAYDEPVAWVRRVALNRLLNGQRNRRRRGEILAAVRPPDPVQLDPSDLDLQRALGELAPRMRAAVCLHYLADLPVAEVAAALGVSDGTVKSALHDARLRLRSALEVSDAH